MCLLIYREKKINKDGNKYLNQVNNSDLENLKKVDITDTNSQHL